MTSLTKGTLAPVRVGFIPLTDCAPLAMAAAKGFDRKHGIKLELDRKSVV